MHSAHRESGGHWWTSKTKSTTLCPPQFETIKIGVLLDYMGFGGLGGLVSSVRYSTTLLYMCVYRRRGPTKSTMSTTCV